MELQMILFSGSIIYRIISAADYLKIYPFMGAAIGRYANRIKNASFKIDDNEFPVSKNWDADQLHGGFEGFDKRFGTLFLLTNNAISCS